MKLSPTLAAATAISFALGFPFGTLAVPASTPATVMLVRFTVSAVIIGAIAAAMKLPWPRGWQAYHAAIVGIVSQGFQFLGVYIALDHGVPPAIAALIVAMNPVLTAVVATKILGEALSARRVLALVIGIAAIFCAFAERLFGVGAVPAAALWAIVGLAGISLGGIYQQRYLHSGHSMTNYSIGVAAALVPAGVLALFTGVEVSDWQTFGVNTALIVLFNGLISSVLYMMCIKQGGAAATSMLFGVIPSIAAVASWIMLGQRLDVGVAAGLLLGALSCYLGYTQSRRKRASGVIVEEPVDSESGGAEGQEAAG